MEITQFTYFQQMAGFECKPVSVEITYGLERICMFTQQQKNVYDLLWNDEGVKYQDVFHQAEKEFSAYNFEHANIDNLFKKSSSFSTPNRLIILFEGLSKETSQKAEEIKLTFFDFFFK